MQLVLSSNQCQIVLSHSFGHWAGYFVMPQRNFKTAFFKLSEAAFSKN